MTISLVLLAVLRPLLLLLAIVQPLGLAAALRTVIAEHPYTTVAVMLLVALALFNAAVQAMEKPTERDGRVYRFVYRFAHVLAFNFKYAMRAKFPQYVPPDGDGQAPAG